MKRKLKCQHKILTEERMEEISAQLEYSPHKPLKCLAQETGVSNGMREQTQSY